MLYHDEERVRKYLQDKAAYPEGCLFKIYGKDRIKKKFKK